MFTDKGPLGERVFVSADVARLAGISLRQLQWWDECKLVSPRQEGHRRVYVPEQVLEILTVAVLRRKGVSLQKIRRILRLLRRGLGHQDSNVRSANSKLYLVTDGNSIFIEDQPENILNRLVEANKAMYLVSLSEQMKRITSEEAPRRYRNKQFQLFENSARADQEGIRPTRSGRQQTKSSNSL
jgi:DNA-binding transcriptional MerR regulator